MCLIFAQVGAIHMHFPLLQVVSSADGIGLVLKDAIVEAAKAGQIAEECRDAKGLARGKGK